ncbi:MAG: signal peptidase I [Bacilli bacterium]
MIKNKFFRFMLISYFFLIMLVVWNIIICCTSSNYSFVDYCGYSDQLNFIKYTYILIFTIVIFLSVLIILNFTKHIISINKANKIMIILLIIIISLFGFLCNIKLSKLNYISIECKVSGSSMYPTFINDDLITVNYSRRINRYDVIVFKANSISNLYCSTDDKYYIKRIIGLPNDTIMWIDKKLYINGELINEVYLNGYYDGVEYESTSFNGIFSYIEDGNIKTSTTIPEGYCFVLGDNRQKKSNGVEWSIDSRLIGLVPITNIIGIVK